MDYMKSNSQPVSADYVFLNLRKRILKLELEPGTRISENQMADEYGVSRTIIRKLDSAFHRAIAESVERYNLIKLLEDLMLHITRWRNFDVALGKRMPHLIDEHRKIVNEIKGGDFVKAQHAMAEHLETISEIRDKAKKNYSQYFINI